jgi:hypothetical protein
MRTRRTNHFVRSFVAILGAMLVLSGAGFAAARTMTGAPWKDVSLSATGACVSSDGTTDDTAGDASPEASETESPEASETESPASCAPADTDPPKEAADAQVFSEGQCGSAALGDAKLTDSSTDAETAHAYESLADALNSGQVDHTVQSVRVLMRNCEAHANDGPRNALYHHALNWVRHYEHERWLEQRFADKWPNGKPGGAHESATHGKPAKNDTTHGNPHDADPSWAPGGGSSSSNGNRNGNGRTW